MRNLFCLFFCFLSFQGQAQIEFSSIQGKWQEESRSNKKEKNIEFTDTLRLEIRATGFMMIRHAKGSTNTGMAELKGSKLKLQDEKFELESASETKLVLSDGNAVHHFKKNIEFTSSPVAKLVPGVETGKKDLSFLNLKGKWTVYKKTDPAFKPSKFYIKTIEFLEDKGKGTYSAASSFNSNDSVYFAEAVISIQAEGFVIQTKQETIKTIVLKSDENEMILQCGDIHYFLKQFGRK